MTDADEYFASSAPHSPWCSEHCGGYQKLLAEYNTLKVEAARSGVYWQQRALAAEAALSHNEQIGGTQ